MLKKVQLRNVPDEIAARLARRAHAHGRTVEDEALAILEQNLGRSPLSASEVLRRARSLGLSTPDEATAMIREDRDAR